MSNPEGIYELILSATTSQPENAQTCPGSSIKQNWKTGEHYDLNTIMSQLANVPLAHIRPLGGTCNIHVRNGEASPFVIENSSTITPEGLFVAHNRIDERLITVVPNEGMFGLACTELVAN